MVIIVKNRLIKTILFTGLILISTLHVLKIVFSGFAINQFSLIVFGLFFFALFKENRKLYSIAFIAQGIMTTITLTEIPSISPVLFFFIALLYLCNPDNIIAIIVSIPSCFLISYYVNGIGTTSNVIEGILFNYGFLIFLYFAVIRQPSKIDHLSKVTPLSCRQLLILKYLSFDIPRKQIVDKVSEKELWKYDIDNFTLDIINSEIAKIKKILEIDSEFSLGIWYNKKTEIPE